ncbi:hypothetical protein [Elizabethkingia anophelis]|uniref:hypothetical protein n=1 Tax=Elizabethkingia anophelis TaxID=1117645 RepID=UPI00301C98F0
MTKKHYIFILLMLFPFTKAQNIHEIRIFQKSKNFIIFFSIDNTYIAMDSQGRVLSLFQKSKNPGYFDNIITPNGQSVSTTEDSDFDYTKDNNNPIIKNSSNNNIEYYTSFTSNDRGKIRAVNGEIFQYYSELSDGLAGNIKSIGNINFSYYGSFNNYEKGKIKSIGGIVFSYFNEFDSYKTGKIKSIKGNNNNTNITIINDY